MKVESEIALHLHSRDQAWKLVSVLSVPPFCTCPNHAAPKDNSEKVRTLIRGAIEKSFEAGEIRSGDQIVLWEAEACAVCNPSCSEVQPLASFSIPKCNCSAHKAVARG
jgi:hypothetical protein